MRVDWTTVFAGLLGTAGLLAELNLLRIFIGDWRRGAREERSATRPTRTRAAQKIRISSRPFRGVAACVMASAAGAVHAQSTQAQPTQPESQDATVAVQAPSVEAEQKSPLSLQLNLDFTNAYFYHGIFQQDRGLIVQPAARLTLNLYEQGDLKVDAILATWNSFGPNGGTQTSDLTQYWYESDLIGGLAITKGKFSLTTTYTFLTSPADAFETVQELDFTLAFDDSEALGKFALHPYMLLGIETSADASDGANSDPGVYLELGIAPGFSFDAGETPVALSFPVSVGLSLDNYYQDAAGDDDVFGFVQVGMKASIPLPFGDRFGKWTLNAGIAGLFLGDNTADYNGGDSEQFIGTVGVQVNF